MVEVLNKFVLSEEPVLSVEKSGLNRGYSNTGREGGC